jgi:GNAT superfamily N-acetyltransferase
VEGGHEGIEGRDDVSERFDPRRAEAMDVAFARRIVMAARATGLRPHAAWLEVAGGAAVYTAADSHLSRAVGIAQRGPITAADFDALEHFYRSRGAPCPIQSSPYAHASLLEQLALRGFRPVAWTDVLARSLRNLPAAQADGVDVERVPPGGITAWARLVESGFAEGGTAGEGFVTDSEIMGNVEGMTCFVARVNGAGVGGGLLAVDAELAWIGSGSTLPPARGRGVQSVLVRARLAAAREHGARWVWVSSTPGSVSHRNLLRLGFDIVGSRLRFVAE